MTIPRQVPTIVLGRRLRIRPGIEDSAAAHRSAEAIEPRMESEARETARSKAAAKAWTEAEDIDVAKASLNEIASSSAGLWITFLSFATYLAIAVGSVTHRQLFLQDPMQLPLLNVGLPL